MTEQGFILTQAAIILTEIKTAIEEALKTNTGKPINGHPNGLFPGAKEKSQNLSSNHAAPVKTTLNLSAYLSF